MARENLGNLKFVFAILYSVICMYMHWLFIDASLYFVTPIYRVMYSVKIPWDCFQDLDRVFKNNDVIVLLPRPPVGCLQWPHCSALCCRIWELYSGQLSIGKQHQCQCCHFFWKHSAARGGRSSTQRNCGPPNGIRSQPSHCQWRGGFSFRPSSFSTGERD